MWGHTQNKEKKFNHPESADLQVVHVVIFIQDLIRRPSFRTLTNAAGLRRKGIQKCKFKRLNYTQHYKNMDPLNISSLTFVV